MTKRKIADKAEISTFSVFADGGLIFSTLPLDGRHDPDPPHISVGGVWEGDTTRFSLAADLKVKYLPKGWDGPVEIERHAHIYTFSPVMRSKGPRDDRYIMTGLTHIEGGKVDDMIDTGSEILYAGPTGVGIVTPEIRMPIELVSAEELVEPVRSAVTSLDESLYTWREAELRLHFEEGSITTDIYRKGLSTEFPSGPVSEWPKDRRLGDPTHSIDLTSRLRKEGFDPSELIKRAKPYTKLWPKEEKS